MQDNSGIRTLVAEGIHYIGLPDPADRRLGEQIQSQIEHWMSQDANVHILDFTNIQTAASEFLQIITDFSKQLAATGKELVSINLQKAVYQQLEKAGLLRALNPTDRFPGRNYPQKLHTSADMGRLLQEYLETSTPIILSSALGLNCSVKRVGHPPLSQVNYVSHLTAAAKGKTFEVQLCFPQALLAAFARIMMGNEIDLDESLVEGMSHEMLNLIYGRAQSRLNEAEGLGMRATIPAPRPVNEVNFERVHIFAVETKLGTYYMLSSAPLESQRTLATEATTLIAAKIV